MTCFRRGPSSAISPACASRQKTGGKDKGEEGTHLQHPLRVTLIPKHLSRLLLELHHLGEERRILDGLAFVAENCGLASGREVGEFAVGGYGCEGWGGGERRREGGREGRKRRWSARRKWRRRTADEQERNDVGGLESYAELVAFLLVAFNVGDAVELGGGEKKGAVLLCRWGRRRDRKLRVEVRWCRRVRGR